MAVSLTLVSATPYALKYLYSYDGSGGANSGTVVRTQATILADFLAAPGPSPLKDLLANVPSDGAWGLLDQGAKMSIYTNMTSQPVAGSSLSSDLEVVVPNGRVLRCIGKDGVAMSAVVELRFHHTIDR